MTHVNWNFVYIEFTSLGVDKLLSGLKHGVLHDISCPYRYPWDNCGTARRRDELHNEYLTMTYQCFYRDFLVESWIRLGVGPLPIL